MFIIKIIMQRMFILRMCEKKKQTRHDFDKKNIHIEDKLI